MDKYKARLFTKGFKQQVDLDFFDTFLVTHVISIRLLIVVVAICDLKIHQIDVKTTFLNVNLNEKLYTDQPEGFVDHGLESKVHG